ncbi:MAG: hypothetical protein J7598_13685 [Mitsuaria chitosanitabida]|jgi:hypothetical protein|uniref:hypothetical protein n=1 Tax=Roseateles chitosanitabidus TaxID=65048 RepID=UPI001B135571|nr:hypothetical protein [Roseateles chitosanitabidus]MBO9687652.1 hypothetical protein [Roseateles chitosanitabidus]
MNMHHIARCAGMVGLALATLTGPGAQAASIGTIFGTPHIVGSIRPGEFEEAKKDLSGHFDKPLSLKLAPASNPLEVMHIGLWLREQQPAIKLSGSCVGACAWFMLDSGRSLEIAKGSLIAFSTLPEMWADLRDQIERGEISINDDRSRAAARNFIAKVPAPLWAAATTLREQRLAQARTPAWIQRFVETTTSLTIQQLRQSESDNDWGLTMSGSPHRCLWWIPDAEGLRQLGLEPGRYAPPDLETAAKALNVPTSVLYVGPALRELPEQPLCNGVRSDDPNRQLQLPWS